MQGIIWWITLLSWTAEPPVRWSQRLNCGCFLLLHLNCFNMTTMELPVNYICSFSLAAKDFCSSLHIHSGNKWNLATQIFYKTSRSLLRGCSQQHVCMDKSRVLWRQIFKKGAGERDVVPSLLICIFLAWTLLTISGIPYVKYWTLNSNIFNSVSNQWPMQCSWSHVQHPILTKPSLWHPPQRSCALAPQQNPFIISFGKSNVSLSKM